MMTSAMHNRMNRILHQHDWETLEEWVRTLEELAALSENEIEALFDSRDQQVPAAAIAGTMVRIAPLHAAVHAS
jgi:hypothetical protein